MADVSTIAKGAVGVGRYLSDLAFTKIPQAAGPVVNSGMVKLIDWAIDGVGVLPSAKRIAGWQLWRSRDVDLAVTAVVRMHAAMAAAQGVVSNIGGLVSAVIGTPINATGLIMVQVHMVACIAHLHGYNVDDSRVRTAVAMCLLGDYELERQISTSRLPTTPAAVATSPVHDPRLHCQVADRVLSHIVSESAGKSLAVAVARKTPIIGGGVGGVADWLNTTVVSQCARNHLPVRRPLVALPHYENT